jgi:putative ABC transport system permease protein
MTHVSTLIIALRGIFSNRLRSFLTILGVIMGIASVIALSSVGEGSKQMVMDRIGSLGSNLLIVSPGAASEGLKRMEKGTARTLTYEDALVIAASPQVTAVKAVAPEVSTNAQVVAGSENVRVIVYGVTPEYEEVRNKTIAAGSFISQSNVDQKSSITVIGSGVAEDLFGEMNPVGQTIKIDQRQYTVVGVLASEEGMLRSDDSILVPITSVMYRLDPQRTSEGDHIVKSIYLQSVSDSQNDLAITQVTEVLQEEHRIPLGGEDDFSVTSMQDIEETLTETSDTLTMLLTITAAIALFVAGLGIMNIMLVSVTERTREIGIRKAVGAKRRNILMQFLLEALTISVIGGVIGIGVGIGASKLLSGSITMNFSEIETVITPDTIIIAFVVAVAIGIVAGVYPAFRASRLNPIDALRYE